MKIPDELLKMSEKEQKEILSDSPYKSKYFIYDNHIYEILSKKNHILYRDLKTDNLIVSEFKNFHNLYKPLTFEKYKQCLQDNMLSKLRNKTNKELIEIYFNILTKVYNKEHLDIIDNTIIIYFPEITVTNTLEQSLQLRDIYIRFNFQHGLLYYIQFARTRASQVELNNSYLFSHINYFTLGNYTSSFCFGGSTPIAKVIEKCRRSVVDCFKNIENLGLLLKEYLSWESLEGIPFTNIGDVLENKNKYTVVSGNYFSESIFDLSMEALKDNLDSFTYEYELTKGIKLTKESIQVIDDILSASEVLKDYMYLRLDTDSVIENVNIESFLHLNGNNSQVIFKGNQVKCIVDKVENLEIPEKQLDKKIHVVLLNRVILNIEQGFTKFIINKRINECII